MSPFFFALLVYLGYLLLGLGLAAAGLWAWIIFGGHRDRRRKRARPGPLPEDTFRSIVEANYGRREAGRL